MNLAADFSKPSIEYGLLSPLLIVFGVALVGVLVEAFVAAQAPLPGADRAGRRRPASARWSRPCSSRPTSTPAGDGAGRGQIAAEGAIAVDGPTVFIWGTHPRAVADQRAAVRRAPPRGRRHRVRRPGRGAAGHRGRARGVHQGPRAHRGLPADDVLGRRHDAVPGGQRPAHDVRGARGPVAAALPALRPGPPSPAAQPGGGAEVLPARRVLLRLLPVRHRADLRLRRLDELRRTSPRRSPAGSAARRCCSAASACSRSACCSRSAPRRSTPGRPTSTRAPRPRSPRSWRPAPRSPRSVRCCGCSTSRSAPPRWDWTPMIWHHRDPHHAGRLASSRSPRPTSSGCWPTPRSRTPGFLLTGFVGLHAVTSFDGDEISSLQAVLFYLVTYGFMTIGAFAVVTRGPRRRRRGDPPVAVGRARQGVPARRRASSRSSCSPWPASR